MGLITSFLGQVKRAWGSGLFHFLPFADTQTHTSPILTCVCPHMVAAGRGDPADAQHNLGSGNLTPDLLWQTSKILPEPRQGFVLHGKGRWWQPVTWPRVGSAWCCPQAGLRLRGAPGPSHVSWTFLGLLLAKYEECGQASTTSAPLVPKEAPRARVERLPASEPRSAVGKGRSRV